MLEREIFREGYITGHRWAAAGRSRSALYQRLAAGSLVKAARGVYRDARAAEHRYEDTFAAYLKMCDLYSAAEAGGRPGLAIAGAAAAEVWGYSDLHAGPVDFFTKESKSRRFAGGSIQSWSRPAWFGRPTRIVERWGMPVLRPEWLAVDLLERGIGDRGHVRAMLDHSARSGDVSAGDLVVPLAELLAVRSTSPAVGTLTTTRRALILQLGPWQPEPQAGGPLVRDGYGTDLTEPPIERSRQETLRLAASGYWHLDPRRAAKASIVIAARQGRTLSAYYVDGPPIAEGDSYWFQLTPAMGDAIHDEFVGPTGKTFTPTRNPVRYWPPA